MSGRYLYGDTRPVMAPILTAQAVALTDLVMLNAGNIIRAADVPWPSAIATPNAATVANTAINQGSPLTAATTAVKLSYQFKWGEGPLSASASATPTAGAGLLVSGASLTPPADATQTNIYVESSAGSGVFLYNSNSHGEAKVILTYGAGTAPTSVPEAGSQLLVAQYNFAVAFLGASAQQKSIVNPTATLWGNGLPNLSRVDCDGYFTYDLDTTYTFGIGDYFAPAQNITANGLQSQVLTNLGPQSQAGLAILSIAIAVEAGVGVSQAKVKIQSNMSPAY